MANEMLKIKLLGGLEVQCNDIVVGIANSTGKSKKMWVLFEYLVINFNRKVSQSELIEMLWPNEEVSNPANSLKVLAFKLRHELDRLEYYTGKEIICSVHGSYFFNEGIPHEIDVVEFEKKVDASKKSDLKKDEKLAAILDALDCFKGSALTDSQKEPWAASLQTHYNELYKNLVGNAVKILTEKKDYEGVIEVGRNALLVQPYEENFYYYLIRAYAAMENYSAASEMYKQITAIMQKEYGTTVDKKFEGAYKEIMKERPKKNLTVEQLTYEFEEKNNFVASFYVEYGEFRQIYRYIARKLERIGNGAFMCVYTLGVQKGADFSTDDKRFCIKVLGEALAFTLRQGDVFTRATPNQYAVIFTDITRENAEAIAKRIERYFEKHKKTACFGVLHTVASIEASEFEKKRNK